MRKKFIRTLTFEQECSSVSESSHIEARRRSSARRKSDHIMSTDQQANNYKSHHQNGAIINNKNAPPKARGVPFEYASQLGLTGTFVPIKNDFSVTTITMEEEETEQTLEDADCIGVDRYQDEAHWTRETREKVKRVRYVICLLALLGLALGLMSRLILNVSIVEMVKRHDVVPGEDLPGQTNDTLAGVTTLRPPPPPQVDNFFTTTISPGEAASPALSLDPLIYAATYKDSGEYSATTTPSALLPDERAHQSDSTSDNLSAPSAASTNIEPRNNVTTEVLIESQEDFDDLHFNWSKQNVNSLLGAFYMGYGPGILFSGSVAQRYGAKWPLFVCVFGSALINIFTPLIAQTSLNLLIGSRVTLGLIQGSLLPCLYELFNRWLTQTESSIFAPLIKVSMPLGSLLGTMMPGIVASLKLEWPILFYFGGALCLAWSLAWLFLATSLPQDNRFVGAKELRRIMRKKNVFTAQQQATITEKSQQQQPLHNMKSSRGAVSLTRQSKEEIVVSSEPAAKRSTPWLQIITNPSVLALTAVKFTYNIAMDFVILQLAVYLREVHNAPIETISAIASSGYCMQMLLIAFIGWLAKVVVLKHAFGLSTTKWRKIFQGSSNFLMALAYLALAYASPDLKFASAMVLLVCFSWMLGAGGESMVPYDLSSEYPASIVGFAHSVSILSGVSLTATCDLIVGENTEDYESWSLLFYLLSATIALGGFIFVMVVKAKPFLPGEKVPKRTRLSLQQQQQQHQQVSIISGSNKANKSKSTR